MEALRASVLSKVQWCAPLIVVLRGLREVELDASLAYTVNSRRAKNYRVRFCFKKKRAGKQTNTTPNRRSRASIELTIFSR